MADSPKLVVFVHGWSVRSTDTYGALPERLEVEARRDRSVAVDVRHLWLSKYVSFRDEVRMEDLVRAFDAALRDTLGRELDRGRRFACITHSTGGPLVREWWSRVYLDRPGRRCPMSHLVMLAPPHFGSALAQLGKGRLSRIRTWFQGVEPGRRVLDWLELGSPEAWSLNRRWFDAADPATGRHPVFVFSLTGQRVDHKLYDHVNAYTGELGSDGVVRAASANLNATYVLLRQDSERGRGGMMVADPPLRLVERRRPPRTAFTLVPGRSHSGTRMGILRSVRRNGAHPTVDRVLDCLRVGTAADYRRLCDRFEALTAEVEREERAEKEKRLLPDRWFIHDPCAMVTFRIEDHAGHALDAYDLRLMAGKPPSPDGLPPGFFRDRQRNARHPGTLTYFFNHAVMSGCDAVTGPRGEPLRGPLAGAQSLGFRIEPHDLDGHVHHLEGELAADRDHLRELLRPHETTLVDVEMRRVVHEGVFQLTRERRARSFQRDPPGSPVE